MESFHGLTPVFNEPNLVSAGGLAPLLALADSAGLSQAVADGLTVPSANSQVKGSARRLRDMPAVGADTRKLAHLPSGGSGLRCVFHSELIVSCGSIFFRKFDLHGIH